MIELKSVPVYSVTIGVLAYWILINVISVLVMRKRGLHIVDGLVPRKGDVMVPAMLKSQGVAWGFIVLAFVVDEPSLAAFGYVPGANMGLSVGVGVVSYAIFLWVYERAIRALGKYEQAAIAAYLTHRIIWPRTRKGRRKLLWVLLLNPFSEELLFRGFLVFYLANLTGFLEAFLLLGLGACLVVHCYQDLRLLPFHAGVYGVTVCLLFSPFGLVACFGFHLAGDLYPMTQLKKQLEMWKKSQRAARKLDLPAARETRAANST